MKSTAILGVFPPHSGVKLFTTSLHSGNVSLSILFHFLNHRQEAKPLGRNSGNNWQWATVTFFPTGWSSNSRAWWSSQTSLSTRRFAPWKSPHVSTRSGKTRTALGARWAPPRTGAGGPKPIGNRWNQSNSHSSSTCSFENYKGVGSALEEWEWSRYFERSKDATIRNFQSDSRKVSGNPSYRWVTWQTLSRWCLSIIIDRKGPFKKVIKIRAPHPFGSKSNVWRYTALLNSIWRH